MSQIIPLTNDPNQQISVSLNVNGSVLRLQLFIYFNEMSQVWEMDISDSAGNLLVCDVPLLTGTWPAGNMLAQYGYMNIGSAYIINLGQTSNDYPNSTELGSGFSLLWDSNA